jgi:hypothetical protein
LLRLIGSATVWIGELSRRHISINANIGCSPNLDSEQLETARVNRLHSATGHRMI